MVSPDAEKQDGASDEVFIIVKASRLVLEPRLGQLSLSGRKVIDTPHYLGNTSRGAIPHITQDNFPRRTSINGVYVALEDFIERTVPPVYKATSPDGLSPLRNYIALPDETLLVLGARRTPSIAAPLANSNTHETISVSTAVGFKVLHARNYADAVEKLKPDIVIGLGDIPYGRALGSKRIEKATDRNIQWLQDHVALRQSLGKDCQSKMFAPMLPVSCAKQQFYVDVLTDELAATISGLGIYDLETLEDVPESLSLLPRLSFTAPESPHELLRQVALGMDLFIIPFMGAATDAGIALAFVFPCPTDPGPACEPQDHPTTLGVDMWSSSHAADLSPLTPGCQCYACTHHHRAFVQHLLSAKEMLGWVLLQIHNHHVMDAFFAGIRQSIANGRFEQDTKEFQRVYEALLPEKTGQGPRVRGYQFKSEGPGEPKKNPPPFTILDDGKERLAKATAPGVDVAADPLSPLDSAERE